MNRYMASSMSIHVALFILSIVIFKPLLEEKRLGQMTAPVMMAYISSQPFKISAQKKIIPDASTAPSLSTQSKPTQSLVKKVHPSPKQHVALKQKNAERSSEAQQVSQGESANALLILLHNAIQRSQHYPRSAAAMRRQGKARVAFVLSRLGQASDIALVQSSGVGSLDQAALDAVRAASPFQGVDRYLSDSRVFEIDLVFALHQ